MSDEGRLVGILTNRDLRFETNVQRVRNRAALKELLQEAIGKVSAGELVLKGGDLLLSVGELPPGIRVLDAVALDWRDVAEPAVADR